VVIATAVTLATIVLRLQTQNCYTAFWFVWDKPTLTLNSSERLLKTFSFEMLLRTCCIVANLNPVFPVIVFTQIARLICLQ